MMPTAYCRKRSPMRMCRCRPRDAVLARVAGGTVFTTVEAQVSQGKGLELGIDIPKEEDPEESGYLLALPGL